MKFSIHLSSMGLSIIMALVLGALLITDINAHHNALVSTQATTDRVVTREFVLVDDQGKTRARIGMSDADAPCLQLYDRQGQQRAMLRLNRDDVPSLRLYDASGRLRSAMGFELTTMNPVFVEGDTNGRLWPIESAPFVPSSFLMDKDLSGRDGLRPPPSDGWVGADIDSSVMVLEHSEKDPFAMPDNPGRP